MISWNSSVLDISFFDTLFWWCHFLLIRFAPDISEFWQPFLLTALKPETMFLWCHRLHKVLPCITLYYTACTRCFPVLLRTTTLAQALSSTTSYYKTCTQYFPVLLCTTALEALPPVPEHGGSGSCLLTLNSFNVYGIFMGLLNLMFGLYDLLFRGFDLLAVVLPRFAAWCNQIDASLHFSLDRPVSEGFYYLLFFLVSSPILVLLFGLGDVWMPGTVSQGNPKNRFPPERWGPGDTGTYAADIEINGQCRLCSGQVRGVPWPGCLVDKHGNWLDSHLVGALLCPCGLELFGCLLEFSCSLQMWLSMVHALGLSCGHYSYNCNCNDNYNSITLHYTTLHSTAPHYTTSTPRYTYNYNFNCDRSCSCNYNSTTLRSTAPHYHYHYHYHYATPHYNYNYNYNYNNYYSYNYNYSNTTTATATTAVTTTTLHYNYDYNYITLHYATLHPAVLVEVTSATTPKNTTPTTFRSISGFALPSMHHKNSPLL